jgi:hypothetical protein
MMQREGAGAAEMRAPEPAFPTANSLRETLRSESRDSTHNANILALV